MQDHKERLHWWSILSIYCSLLGVLLGIRGVPLNKSLYSVSCALVTSACAGFTFNITVQVDRGCMELQMVVVYSGVDGEFIP
ncbi:hypothetical protein vseg_012845 [Gypsophila vaccaria]